MDDATQKLVDEAHGWCPACGGSGMVMEFGPTDCPNLAVHRALEAAQRPPVNPEGVTVENSPTLAAHAEAAKWGYNLSSAESAYIAEAVLAASGLRETVVEERKANGVLLLALHERPPVSPEVLNEVWSALGCERNPEDFRPNVRAKMWGQALDMIRESVAQDGRIYRENQHLEAEVLRLRERPPVSPEVREAVERVRAKLDRIPDSEAVTLDKTDVRALLSFPSQPVYDEEKITELLRSQVHAPGNQHDPCTGECVSCPWPLHELPPEDVAAALVAALRGGELTREEESRG